MINSPSFSEATIICTRNRPEELGRTLKSVASQTGTEERLVLVVDGSDPDEAESTRRIVETWTKELPFRYHRFQGSPAHTRQRNAGIELLPPSVNIIHFIDDDVTLRSGYFQGLRKALNQHSLLGVGGQIFEPGRRSSHSSWVHRLFLLDSPIPSHVLPSGQTSPPSTSSGEGVHPAKWLSTCSSSYRRSVFRKHRFDPEVEGPSPTLHDLDFSFRVAQDGPLAVTSAAQLEHHRSPKTRRNVHDAAAERAARRYWFVNKNLDSNLHRLAFWWSMIGKGIILLLSLNPKSKTALPGFLRGIRLVWTRNHPLL